MNCSSVNKPLTVVIPVYNRGNLVVRTLDSVARQDVSLFNLVVVDNNSTDNSEAVIRKWMADHPEVSALLVSETYQSASAARNRGLAEVCTPWVMFFDSDDIMLPGHVSSAVDVAQSNPDADIVGWDVSVPLYNGSTRLMRFPYSEFMKNHIIHGSLSTLRYMVRTSFIRNAGEWNRTVRKWDDYELGVRLLSACPKVAVRKGEPLVKIHFTADSITGTSFTAGAGEWERALDEIERTLKQYSPEMTDWITYRRADLASEYRKEGSPELAAGLLDKAKANADRKWLAPLIYNLKKICPRGVWHVADLVIR